MARTSSLVQIGRRKFELSNLQKVLFPDDNVIKAELIQYYLKVAPTMLRHVKGRALSFIRYPDGINGQSFFQKNRPEWAPPWIDHATLGQKDDSIDYVVATEEASLVWLANLACIEVHEMTTRQPHLDKPDYIAFDLDPPEGYPFKKVAALAFDLRAHVERLGYHTFVKTSGAKGIHVVTPIEQKWDVERVHEIAASIARSFVDVRGDAATLFVKKELRKGKVLIDINRNRLYQTVASPYTVRARPRAPVSMPLTWEELGEVSDPAVFNIRTAIDRLMTEGDAWEAIRAYATPIHTERKQTSSAPKSRGRRGQENPKAEQALTTYARKRKFDRTPEPPPSVATGNGNAFVIHRHHATRLHYDLRLEREGTLKSWAVPRGVPPRPGVKRLAVAVEDHPLSYLTFEGRIPKGEYGGGDVWVFALGRYEITKDKKDSFYFRLQSRELNAEYRLIHTRGNEWLLERLDTPQIDWLRDPIEPMLAQLVHEPIDSPEYLYEVKWDGIRAMISVDDGEVRIRTRNKLDITERFPELLIPEDAFRAAGALYDGEIVCLDESGRPVFHDVIRRMQQTSPGAISRMRAKHPAVCYLFDCLYLDGRPIVNEPLERRRAWLVDSIKRQQTVYRVSEAMSEGRQLFEAASKMGLEGIVAKLRDSPYLPGKRNTSWLKIKSHSTLDCVILGYTKGKGSRAPEFGALQLGRFRKGQLVYVGKVGGGFDDRQLKSIFAELKKIKEAPRAVEEKPLDDKDTVWIEPVMVCEVRYTSLTKQQYLREPVFVRLRPDLSPQDCAE